MQALIFSDSHGMSYYMELAAEKYKETAEIFFFLGDGINDFFRLRDKYLYKSVCSVPGNSELYSGEFRPQKPYSVFEIKKHKILLTHGHMLGVKTSLDPLIAAAQSEGCDIAFFGHTHRRYNRALPGKNLTLFNPGSIGEPRGSDYSFGILEITEKSFTLSHGDASLL